MRDVFQAAIEEIKNKKKFVISTVTKTIGSTPQKTGAKLLVREDGSGVGTLGGGCVEGDIWFASNEKIKRDEKAKFDTEIIKKEEKDEEAKVEIKFNREFYTSLNVNEKEKYLHEIIYPFVYSREPRSATKIIGMLLTIDDEELINYCKNTDNLIEKIEDASRVLKRYNEKHKYEKQF